jgi:hypothetical protein
LKFNYMTRKVLIIPNPKIYGSSCRKLSLCEDTMIPKSGHSRINY